MKKSLASFFSLLVTATMTLALPTTVGTTNATFAVSDMGATTYAIPIEVPQGICGLQPNISLAYNSQSGNGVCGMGFSISGISAITRIPRSLYYDGASKGIQYNSTDAYALDGRRLLLTSGTDGSDGAKYGIEGDPLTEVVLHGGGTDQWWEVKSGGVTMKYGSTTDGKNMAGTCAVVWYVDYAIDTRGNFIEYVYL